MGISSQLLIVTDITCHKTARLGVRNWESHRFLVRNTWFSSFQDLGWDWEKMLQDLHVAGAAGWARTYACRGLAHRATTTNIPDRVRTQARDLTLPDSGLIGSVHTWSPVTSQPATVNIPHTSVVPVIDMSLTGMIPLTLRHDSSHLFNQRALQEHGKMGYSGPRPPSVPGVLATTLHHDPVTWSSMIVEFSEWVTCNYHVWYSRRVRIAQNQSSRHVKSP